MKPRKLPLAQSLKATQHYSFSEQINPSDGSWTVDVEGTLPRWLKKKSRGSGLRISGTPKEAQDYELMIVEKRVSEKRVSKITIHVSPGQSVWNRPLWDLLTGKRSSPPPPKGS